MSNSRISAITLATFDSAGLTGGYDLATVLSDSLVAIRVINNSNTDVFVSYDGVNKNDLVTDGSTLQLTFQNIAEPPNFKSYLARGTSIYLNGAAGVGNIYIAGYY